MGSYGFITVSETTVIKSPRALSSNSLSIDTQKHIHTTLLHILSHPAYILLRVPKFIPNSEEYEMEKIDTRLPVTLGAMGTQVICQKTKERLCEELNYAWLALYKEGYAAWDFELYKQRDGTIMMIDFDKFKPSGTLPEGFFKHPCFPRGFAECLNLRETRQSKLYGICSNGVGIPSSFPEPY